MQLPTGNQSQEEPDISKLKVAELRSELKKKNLPVAGKKDVLLQRLREADANTGTITKKVCSDLPNNSTHSDHVNLVACKCGLDVDKPTLQCLSCSAWSHIECYDFTEATARKVNFLCHVCC